jgi:hypothetical protein
LECTSCGRFGGHGLPGPEAVYEARVDEIVIRRQAEQLLNRGMDEFADAEAGNATDLVWLTWAVPKLVASAAELSLVSASARRAHRPVPEPVSRPQRPVRPAAESAPPCAGWR